VLVLRRQNLWTPTMEELAVSNRVFFYNDGDRSGTTVEFDQSGKISKTQHDFAPGSLGHFTHIVG
jgi:hypothetical protein